MDLINAVFAQGRKGISMQRYKGLGEMNPEQLWETTLDENVRSLLRVKVSELDEADDLFTKLMGDVVEPRRDFIREKCLECSQFGRLTADRRAALCHCADMIESQPGYDGLQALRRASSVNSRLTWKR